MNGPVILWRIIRLAHHGTLILGRGLSTNEAVAENRSVLGRSCPVRRSSYLGGTEGESHSVEKVFGRCRAMPKACRGRRCKRRVRIGANVFPRKGRKAGL